MGPAGIALAVDSPTVLVQRCRVQVAVWCGVSNKHGSNMDRYQANHFMHFTDHRALEHMST